MTPRARWCSSATPPELFRHEIRAIAPVDFNNPKWCAGRLLGRASLRQRRCRGDADAGGAVPESLGEVNLDESASAAIREVAEKLSSALARGDVAIASELFAHNAIYEA